jgi:hypothetical protein
MRRRPQAIWPPAVTTDSGIFILPVRTFLAELERLEPSIVQAAKLALAGAKQDFDSLSIGPRFQVKLLHVKPDAKLSMQMHHHRSEHWVVVHGTAKMTVGDKQQSRVAICSCTSASLAISRTISLARRGGIG